MAESLGAAVLTLSVDDQQYQAGLNRAKAAAEGFRAALAGLGVTASVGAALAFIGNQVKQLDEASAAVRTLGVDSVELSGRLRALSIELGNNISQIELTKAAYDVASSGFATAADATEILRASAMGAKGGFADVNDVAAALTGVLNAYGLSASEATGIVDKFVQTQADGVITVRQYAAEIGNISSIAAASGISINELNAAIATATLRGVPVAQTFTGLRQAISSIIKPSEQAKELAKGLGLDYSVTALKTKGFAGVLADVQAKTGGATDKLAVLLGSVEAQAAVQPLLNDRLAKYNELLGKQAQATGAAANSSQINSQTISGGLAQIGNGFSNLATTLDTTLTPLLGGFIKSINEILVKLNQVSALAPDKVAAREQQAGDIVQAAIGPFGGSGFFSGVSVQFDGKTFSGSATGVREEIVKYLLNKDIAALNKPQAAKIAASPAKQVSTPTPIAAVDFKAQDKQADIALQRQLGELKLQGLQREIDATTTLTGLQASQLVLNKNQGLSDEMRLALVKKVGQAEGTGLLILQNKLALEEKLQTVQEAQLELSREKSKPLADPTGQLKETDIQSPKRIQELQDVLAQARLGVAKAFADAGKALVENAIKAANALKSAQANLESTLRGGFDYLTPQLQQEQLNRARASIQPLVDKGVIRTGLDISTPDRLFQVAGFAESYTSSNQELIKAQKELTLATNEAAKKQWNVNVNVAADGSIKAFGDVLTGALS